MNLKPIGITLTFLLFCGFLDVEKLCESIRKAENSKKYPYGIMVKYKNTTPKQACVNTVRHALKDYKGPTKFDPFLEFLAARYAPIGAKNDPKNLNKNWVKNVSFFYKKVNT
jgi:hypothetical protein